MTHRSGPGPTFDHETYGIARLNLEDRAKNRIEQAFDMYGLAQWIGEQARQAYADGLRDGYVQGRHDRHKARDTGP